MLDTCTVAYVINHKPQSARAQFNAAEGLMCMSAVTLGELVYGAENSQKKAHNLANIEGLCGLLEILPFDDNAAFHFGQIRYDLKTKGQTIGAYDTMIAGHARSRGLILVTNNTKEFARVDGLRLENWV